jgi:hypothetical protein
MDVRDHKDGKIVYLSRAFDSKGKALYFAYFILFFIGGSLFLRLLVKKVDPSIGAAILGILFTGCFFLVAYRFLNKAFMLEKLFVNKQVLQLIKQGVFTSVVKTYKLSDISNFRHLAKPELTRHPLAGESIDYMGFQDGQKVINEMHGDNRLAFDWKGIPVVFGQDVYSWDFEALEVLLYEVTGNDLRYNDALEKNSSGA